MKVKILDTGLIRRFGKLTLDVDSSVGKLWISKKMAIEIVDPVVAEEKQIAAPPMDKMVRGPEESKNLFPSTIIK